ncbi:metallophosphoesterase [Nocardia fluminea]|uniref:metallophosphoesterase n=1 Tax=Nocardia fluminea TaxID=134984 RepID=UPI003428ACA1
MQQTNDSPVQAPAIGRRELLAGAAGIAGSLAGASLLGLNPAHAVPVAAGVTKFGLPAGDHVRILVTGDAGTGTRTQWAVADTAREYHAREPFSMAVGLGDNIYDSGPDDDHDAQFATKFETPNAGLDFPWAMALGNHDTSAIFPGDGGWLERGNFEVAYHAKSPRWWMPSRYYSLRAPQTDPVVELFVLDLTPLAALIPPLLSPYWNIDGEYMNAQREWLDRALAESTAEWKVVCTHFPYLSNGSHGNAGSYDGLPAPLNGAPAKRFYEDHVLGKVNLLLAGHDHSLQVLEPTIATKGARQIVSGAAAKTSGAKGSGSAGLGSSGSGSLGGGSGSSGGSKTKALYESHDRLGFMVLDLTPAMANLRVVTVDPATGTGTEVFDRRL